ncbi:MAG: DNA translocase FtsK 4TM domain-containing protein, partial [Oligoflexia bacterium]|nr:DNA translocase FtsK 4TM domain-containing protein [Oligoflexia bacterium]
MAAATSKRRSTPRKSSSGTGSKPTPSPTTLTWANEALSVLFYAFSAFLLISFLSQELNAGRISFLDPDHFPLLRSPLGPVGKFVGTVLAGFMGWCALVPAAWAALLGKYFWENEDLVSLQGKSPKLLFLVGVLGILIFSCTLAAIFWGLNGGGSVGMTISGPLLRYFSVGGATLIAGAFFLLSAAISTRPCEVGMASFRVPSAFAKPSSKLRPRGGSNAV